VNIKTLVIPTFVFLMGLFSGCGKQKRSKKLGETHYKLALVELEDPQANDIHYKRALNYLDTALSHQGLSRYHALKGTLLFMLGQHSDAEYAFRKALDRCSSPAVRAEINNNYACLLARSEKPQEALEVWERLENDKDYLSPEVALVNQAKLYCAQGKNDIARQKLSLAVQRAPSYLDAHYYRGLVEWYGFQNKEVALQEAQTTLFLDQSHRGARGLVDQIG